MDHPKNLAAIACGVSFLIRAAFGGPPVFTKRDICIRAVLVSILVGLIPSNGGAAPPKEFTEEEIRMAKQAAELDRQANDLYRQDKVTEALTKYEEALTIRRKLYPKSAYPEGHPRLSASLNNVGFMLLSLDRAKKALPFFEESLAMDRKLYKDVNAHPALAGSLNNMGGVLRSLDQPEKALPFFEEALAMYRILHTDPDGHPDLATALNNVGGVWRALGQIDKALRFYKQALAMRRKIYRDLEAHPDLLESLNNIAYLLEALGRSKEALPYFEDALAVSRKLYKDPEGHPELATSLNNMGYVLQSLGRSEKALPFIEKALEMRRKLYARLDVHPDVATSLNNMGYVLQSMGRSQKALTFFRNALTMRRELYKAVGDHPLLANSLNNMGSVLESLGRFEEALQFYQDALAMCRKLYKDPKGHPDLATSLNNMGGVLQSLGRLEEAAAFTDEGLIMRRKLFKDLGGHPDLAKSLDNMGYVLQSLGRLEKALPYYEEALTMNRKLYEGLEGGHPDLAISLNKMGLALRLLDRPEKALPYYEEALTMRRKLYGALKGGHPDLFMSLNNMGVMLESLGRREEARQFYKDALDMARKLYSDPEGHPELATILNNMGYVLHSLGRAKEALPFCEEALAMNRMLHKAADGHPAVAASLNNTGAVLVSLGRAEKALPLLEESIGMYQRIGNEIIRYGPESDAFAFEASLPRTLAAYLSVVEEVKVPPHRSLSVVWRYKAFLTRAAENRRLVDTAFRGNSASEGKWGEFVVKSRQLAAILNAPPPQGITVEETKKLRAEREKKVSQLTNQKELLERELVKLIPLVERDKKLGELGPQDLAPLLPDKAAFIDFVKYYDINENKPVAKYVAFILHKDGTASRVQLKDAGKTDEALADWVDLIRTVLPADAPEGAVREHERKLARAAAVVRERVWDPVESKLPKGTNVVYLAPDGALHQLPWGALPDDERDKVLLMRYTFAFVPHGPYLLKRLRAPAGKFAAPRALLAVGGVKYDAVPREVPKTALESKLFKELVFRGKQWPYLEGSESELRLFANLDVKKYRVKRISGVDASTQSLANELPVANIAHLATHGFFNKELFELEQKRSGERIRAWEPERMGTDLGLYGQGVLNPSMFAGLVLAGANRPDASGPDGGILTADAVRRLDLDQMELVVLSACKTGLGVRADGQCAFTLQQAFHLAGCRNVIAGLWDLPDDSTVALMAIFYKEVLEGSMPPLEALRKAQLFVYHNPEKVRGIYEKYTRGGPLPEVVAVVPKGNTVPEPREGGKKAPARIWAGLVLSGVGR